MTHIERVPIARRSQAQRFADGAMTIVPFSGQQEATFDVHISCVDFAHAVHSEQHEIARRAMWKQWELDNAQTFDRLTWLCGTNGASGMSLAQLSEGMLLPARHIEQLVVYLLDRNRIHAVDHIAPGYPPRYVPAPIAHGSLAEELVP